MATTQENGLQRMSNDLWEHAVSEVRNFNNDSALKYIDEALQIQPSNLKYISLKSEIYLALGKSEKAVDFLRTCLEKFPSLTDLHLDLAIALYNKGDYDDSILELNLCHGKLENDPDVHYFRGLNFIEKNKNEDAKSEFNKALNIDSTLAKPHFALYSVYMSEGNVQKAMKELDLAIRFDPDNHHYRSEKIEELKNQQKTEEAYSELIKMVKACPNDVDAYIYAARELASFGAITDATNIAVEGSVKWPTVPEFHEVLSDNFLGMGYPDNAMKQIDQALELRPHSPELLTKKLNIMITKKNYTEAVELLDHELETDPKSLNLKLLKAQVLSYSDKIEEAKALLAELLESGKGDLAMYDTMLNALGNINKKSDYNDIVIEVCDRILEMNKDRMDVLSLKLSVLINSGKYKEAEDLSRNVLREKEDNGQEFRDFLIDSLILQERIDDAKAELEKIKPEDYNAYNIVQDSAIKYLQKDVSGGQARLDDITKKYNKDVTCYTVKWFEKASENKKFEFISDMITYACGDKQQDSKTESKA
ncbi:MAG: tetratricopeptide repeat protein [Thermoplasmatales archaeon]|nr:tetratricopeptide repeat protein [Thermoplasmatales archaeon]